MVLLNERSAHRRGRYLHNTQETQEKNIHALSRIRNLDPISQASEQLQAYVLDRTATVTGFYQVLLN
jgi:hypothetical protein